jgi:hypothetical protein
MARLLDLLSFIALLVVAFPLAATARIVLKDATIKSSQHHLTKWAYLGCFNETTLNEASTGERAMSNGISESLPNMSVRMCIAFCDSNHFTYAGMEYAR